MKLVFLLLFVLLLIVIWRLVSQHDGVQIFLHKLPMPFPVLLQWYSTFFIGVGVLLCLDMGNIIINDYVETDWLDPQTIADTLEKSNFNATQIEDMWISDGLRYFSLASPMVGLATFLLIFAHVVYIVRKNAKNPRTAQDAEGNLVTLKYSQRRRYDMVLLVIAMPSVFVVMASRSTSRMWMVMRGFNQGEAAAVDLALYVENLELAAVAQYYVVFVFSQLCNDILKVLADGEIADAMAKAGFQGVYAWVIIGAARAVFDFAVALLGAHESLRAMFHLTDAKLQTMEALVSDKLGTIFSVMTLLCVYNMFVVCRLDYIKQFLGNANRKFLGTRLLLLIGQAQLKIIQKVVELSPQVAILQFLDITSDCRGQLLHSSMLTYECLIVVCFNFYAWEVDRGDLEESKEYVESLRDRSGYMRLTS